MKRLMMLIVLLLLVPLTGVGMGQVSCPPGSPHCKNQAGLLNPYTVTAPAHPAVVKIVSARGSNQMHGTGTFLTDRTDDGRGLVLTCAHILRSGFQVTVVFPGPQHTRSRATILATDALHDCALLAVIYPSGLKGLSLAASYPRPGERLTWSGYRGSQGYTSGTATAAGYRGNWLLAQGQVPEGVSGGPLRSSRGLVGIVCEMSRVGNRPWQISGPQVLWIRRFIDRCRTIRNDREKPPPLASVPPRVCKECADLRKQVNLLQVVLARIEAKTCPPGPPGPAGPAGSSGANADCRSLVLRISEVEDVANRALTRANVPLYVKKINTVTGEETIEEIYPGEGLIFKMTPHDFSQLTKREAQ